MDGAGRGHTFQQDILELAGRGYQLIQLLAEVELAQRVVVVQRVEVRLARQAEHRAPVDAAIVVADARIAVLFFGARRRTTTATAGSAAAERDTATGASAGHCATIATSAGLRVRCGRTWWLGRRFQHEEGWRRRLLATVGRASAEATLQLHFALYVPERVADEHRPVEAGVWEGPVFAQLEHGQVQHVDAPPLVVVDAAAAARALRVARTTRVEGGNGCSACGIGCGRSTGQGCRRWATGNGHGCVRCAPATVGVAGTIADQTAAAAQVQVRLAVLIASDRLLLLLLLQMLVMVMMMIVILLVLLGRGGRLMVDRLMVGAAGAGAQRRTGHGQVAIARG